jgi:hypothetical protein
MITFYSVTINGFTTMMNEEEFAFYIKQHPVEVIQRDACPLKQELTENKMTIGQLEEDIEYYTSLFKKADLVINVSRRFLYYLTLYGDRKELRISSGELYYKAILVTLKRSVEYQFQVSAGGTNES